MRVLIRRKPELDFAASDGKGRRTTSGKALVFPKPGDIFQELMEKYHGNDIDPYYAFGGEPPSTILRVRLVSGGTRRSKGS